MKIILIVLLVLIVMGAIGGSLAFYFTKKMTKTADEFISLLANNYPDQAYELFTPKLKTELSYDDFTKILTSSLSAKPQSVSWKSRKVENSDAQVSGIMVLANEHKFTISLELEKAEGEWKISSLEMGPIAASNTTPETN